MVPRETSSNNDEASGNFRSVEELKPLESVYAQSDSAAASVSPAKDEAEGYDRLPSFEEIFYYGIYGRPTCCGTQCSSSYCSGLTPLFRLVQTGALMTKGVPEVPPVAAQPSGSSDAVPPSASSVSENVALVETPSKDESGASKSASEQDDTTEGADEKVGFVACGLILTLFVMIVFVVMTLGYNAIRQRITTAHPDKTEAPKREPGSGSYWVKFAMHPTADAFPWMKGCTTPACLAIRHRLLWAIKPFMNPCKNLNFFSCSVGNRRTLVEHREQNLQEASVAGADTSGQSFWAPQSLAHGRAPRVKSGGQLLRDIMIHQCYLYSESLRDSLEVVQKLSLEYGLHPIVSFVRRFRYTRDPSEPFELRIDITERAKHYFRYWSERDSAGFYNKTLVPLDQKPEDIKELTAGDSEISEIVKGEVDPVTNETIEGGIEVMQIAELANYTEDDISAARWKELLVLYGRSNFELDDVVYANRRALAVLGTFCALQREHSHASHAGLPPGSASFGHEGQRNQAHEWSAALLPRWLY
ncbi:hypothetical protein MRX96_046937 [Rhipicephalus microplus]